MTGIDHEARAEAFKRYDSDRIIDENTGEEVSHDDWGYADTARQAFIAGAEWAAERLSVPPSDDERDLAQALFRTLYDAGVSFQSGDLIPRLTATVRAAGFRRQGPPSDDDREALAYLITAFRFRERGIPGRIGEPDLAIARPLADFLTREGFRRQGPITDEAVEAAARAMYDQLHPNGEPCACHGYQREAAGLRDQARAALEAAERARSAVPSTTEQESGDA